MLIRSLLTIEQRAAIGDLVAESARLEQFVEFFISYLARFKADTEAVFLAGMMLDRKLDTLKALGTPRLNSAKRRAKFEALISKLKALNAERATVVHGSWQPKGGFKLKNLVFTGGLPPMEVVRHRGRRPVQTLSVERVEKLADELNAGTEELYRFVSTALCRPSRALAKALTKTPMP